MTQSNKKANCGGDRISELQGDVMDCILQHMTVRALVRTSILSKKWRYMWISVPRLEFDESFYNSFVNLDDPGSEFSRIITDILFLHSGAIIEFILQLSFKTKITFQNLNKWILLLSRRGVKYIKLENDENDLAQTPSHLFSCKELTYLKLYRFNLSTPRSFCGFKSLLRLHLESMIFKSGALERLLSGCPLLEELAILYCSGCECIDLSSSYALIDLTLSLPLNCVVGLNKSFPMIQRLKLELENKMLLYADSFPLSQLIISLKYLSLYGVNLDEIEELLYIVSVLKSASNLVELDIVTYAEDSDCKTHVSVSSRKIECSSCCLSELEKVNIRVGTSSKHAMSLARFILANSPSLKTLTFDVCFGMKPAAPIQPNILQRLLRMERASQRARVEFINQ